MSPYSTTIDEIVKRFNTSQERAAILKGFLRFRVGLRQLGIWGWQWLGGTFLEDVERLDSRAPKHLEVVTFVVRPPSIHTLAEWATFVQQNNGLFDRVQARQAFSCDAQFVDLALGPYSVVTQARYWLGLFSHQQKTSVWKGMLEVHLLTNDTDVEARSVLGVA